MYGLANILAGLATQDIGTRVKRTKRNAALYILSAIFALTAFVATIMGGGIYLANIYSPMAAAFLIAIGTLAASVVILVAVLIQNRIERRRHHARKALVASATVTALRQFSGWKTPLLLIAAGGLGYLVMQSLKDEETDSG